MNPIAKEPVAVAGLAAIITWVAAKYGAKVDPQLASEAAGIVLVIASGFARQLVRPVAKEEAPLTDEEMAHARELLDTRERLATSAPRKGQVSPARTVPPQKNPGPPPPPPGKPAE